MNIHPVNRKNRGNRYCGPAAISIINGCSTDDAAKLIRAFNGNKPVKGTYTSHLRMALNELGYRVSNERIERGCTLASWLRSTHGERGGKVYVVVAGHHYQVVSGNRFCCSRTGKIVDLKHEKVRRRARVEQVWEISAGVNMRSIKDVLEARYPRSSQELQRKKREASAGSKARRLAKLWDIEIETEVWGWGSDRYTNIIVWGHKLTMDSAVIDDPFAGEHYADGWQDALERVEEYVKLLKQHQLETGGEFPIAA